MTLTRLLDSGVGERVEDIIQVAMEEFSILRALWLYISDCGAVIGALTREHSSMHTGFYQYNKFLRSSVCS